MKITKYVHSCLLVETPDRVALFDPGMMSTPELDINQFDRLDDVFITHSHGDHLDADFVKQLADKFPGLRITTTDEVIKLLADKGVNANSAPPEGAELLASPHESVEPVFPQPQQTGFHYLDKLTHPGDSHSFTDTKAIMALPITGPWGSTIKAANLALELKPRHVLPIHDWHWRDEARQQFYGDFETILGKQGITFHKLVTGQPVEIDV